MNKAFAGITAIVLSLPGGAAAQTTATGGPPAPDATRVQDIVVTARKIAERLQEVPVAITALSGADLKIRSVKALSDIQGVVPGLVLQQGTDDPQTLLFLLRGREQNDVAIPIDPSVGLYIDGHYVPRTYGLQGSLLDISQIEALRGPQGTLYGKNSTGGAISVLTNDPDDAPFAQLDATVGNYRSYNLIGIANIPIDHNLAARFVVQHGGSNGYGHNAVGDRLMSEDSQAYRGKLRATFGTGWSALLSADFQRYRSGGAIVHFGGLVPSGNGLPEGGFLTLETELETNRTEAETLAYLHGLIDDGRRGFYNDAASKPSPSLTKRADVGLTIRGDLGSGLTLVSISGYQHTDRRTTFPSPLPVTLAEFHASVQDAYYSQEFQLLGRMERFKWVAGLYADYESGHDDSSVLAVPLLLNSIGAPPLAVSRNDLVNSTIAPYAQATWEFIPQWRLTGGLRYSRDRRQLNATDLTIDQSGTTACVVPAPGVESTAVPGALAQCPRKFTNSFGNPSWLVSVDHSLSRDILVYAKVASGYRSGGQNEGGSVEIESFAPFRPETNIEYEIGVKSEFFDHKLKLNLAAYRDNYSNLQVTTSTLSKDGNVVQLVTNAATARIQGVEMEADVVLSNNLKLHGSTAYTDARYNRFIDSVLGDRSNEKFAVPRWTANANVQYSMKMPFGRITAAVDYNYRSSANLAPAAPLTDAVTQKAYGLVDARLNIHVDALQADIAVFGKNITRERYVANVGNFSVVGTTVNYVGAPRTFGLEIVKTFR